MLKFSEANAKTKRLKSIPMLQRYLANRRKVYSFDLLSGWSCPGASDCFAKVYIDKGKKTLRDGPNTQFRCFSASQEVLYPNVYRRRKQNFDAVKRQRGYKAISFMLEKFLPSNIGILRYHVGGDFFKREYLEGAVELAERRPDVLFYAYTKSLHHLQYIDMVDPPNGVVRPNFLITTSVGGMFDNLIDRVGLRTATVVFSEADANILELPIDHDDSHAATSGGNFALLLHGVQPAGSTASKALRELKGKGSYGKGR